LQVFFASLGQLVRAPVATLMTVAVIGITLALPAGLYVLLDNARQASGGWDQGAQVSLFLKPAVTDAQAQALLARLRRLPAVAEVQFISREAALAEFKKLSGFGDALDKLASNPLPAVVVVRPTPAHSQTQALEGLVADLRRDPAVDLAQVDLEWVKRLQLLLIIAQRGVSMLAILLGLAVLLIIGNTIRLAVLNRREEIEVIKLIGGTDSFIRRPFLYAGCLYGLLGGVLAWLLIQASLALLSGPIGELSALYGSAYTLIGLPGKASGLLLLAGGGLGWLGARVAVERHLRAIEPA
jgi:cell division transport system permease protein